MIFIFDTLAIFVLAATLALGLTFFLHYLYTSFTIKKFVMNRKRWAVSFSIIFLTIFFLMYIVYLVKKIDEKIIIEPSESVPVVFYLLEESNNTSDSLSRLRHSSPKEIIRREIELDQNYSNNVAIYNEIEIGELEDNKTWQKFNKTKDINGSHRTK